jgi:hypothetical protein
MFIFSYADICTIHTYSLRNQYTPYACLCFSVAICPFTCLHTSTPTYLYMFTYFYVHISIHVYLHLCQYTYTVLYTTTAIFLYMLMYFPAHLLIHDHILLRSYTYTFLHTSTFICVHKHYFEFVNVIILHAPTQLWYSINVKIIHSKKVLLNIPQYRKYS